MSFIRDAIGMAGCGLVVFGLSQWSIPLAWVSGGAFLLFFAAAWSWKAGKR